MKPAVLALGGVMMGAVLALAGGRPGVCKLEIHLVDAETGRTLPGLVRIQDGTGKHLALEGLLPRGQGLDPQAPISRWRVLTGPATVEVPAERLSVDALYGLETEMVHEVVDASGKDAAKLQIPLRRFHDARARGYSSANTHLHLKAMTRKEAQRYLREIPRADGLDIVFLSHLERAEDDAQYISNQFTRDDLAELSGSGVLFSNGEEHRHNFGGYDEGYGHVMFLDILKLIQPVSIGPGIMKRGTDGLPLQKGIDLARGDGATTIWCHNNWGFEDVPSWLTGRLDAQNIFDGGEHGSYQESFYRYLNVGLQVPFSTGTDWFQYDFSRVYASAASPLTVKGWLRSLAAGRSYITNGPLLELEAGGHGPGSTLRLPGAAGVKVVGRAAGRVDFGRLELVVNEKIAATAASRREGAHFAAELKTDVEVREPCWLALRTPPPPPPGAAAERAAFPQNEIGQALFAHTSAVYLEVAGKSVFKRSVALELLEEMERNKELISQKGLFAGDHERQHVLAVHDAAIQLLRQRLAAAQ